MNKNIVGIHIDTGDNEYLDDKIDALRYAVDFGLDFKTVKLTLWQKIKVFFIRIKNFINYKRELWQTQREN